MDEITLNKKTFHQYLILDEIKIPKEDIIKEFGSISKYKILSTKKDNYTERTNTGYVVEYDMFDGDDIIVKNNMGT